MVFSSAVFLFCFLPLTVLFHTFIPKNSVKNILLFAASLLFYAWGEPVYVLLLLFSVVINYLFGKVVAGGKYNKTTKARVGIVLVVAINMAMLVVFKYAGFLVELINGLPMVELPVPQLRMPIGISFYTFQALSYCLDVYRDKEAKTGSLFHVALYIILFPQLVAGPIVKYNSIREQIKDRRVTITGLHKGITHFIIGLSKKMLIANVMAVGADKLFGLTNAQLDMPAAWLGAVCYALQIYFDFSGYSDMAVGMGEMFGFTFPENFNYPYIAGSVRDFWKRWHISLTSWFREYLYFSLGGNKKGTKRTIFNRFFVFLCTGIWHGANLTFLVWGIYHGLLTIIETVLEKKKAKKTGVFKRIAGHIYTLVAVIIGFVIFRADNLGHAVKYIGSMFSFTVTAAGTANALALLTPMFIVVLVIAVIASTPVVKLIKNKSLCLYGSMAVTIVLYILCILEIATGSYNPFIYFRF